MLPLHLPPMLWSSDAAWGEISRRPPSLIATAFGLALPAAMVPPAILLHATDLGSAHYLPALSASGWQFVELALIAAQLVGFLMVLWLVRAVAGTRGAKASARDAFMLTTVSLLPLWLSSLALIQDEILPVLAIPILAIGASVALLKRGARCVLGIREDIVALELGLVAIQGGVLAWATTMVVLLIPGLPAAPHPAN